MITASAPFDRRLAWIGVAVGLVLPTFVTLAFFVYAPHYGPDAQRITYIVMKCVEFSFPILWVWAVLREPIRLWRPTRAGIGLGVAFGLLVATATWGLYHVFLRGTPEFVAGIENVRAKVQSFGIDRPWKYTLFAAFYCLNHALMEEYYFRWFLFGQLRRLLPLWPAIVLSGFGFMLHHVPVLAIYYGWFAWPTVLLSLAVAVGGIYWAWLYDYSGSIAGPCLSHLLVDAGIFFVGFEMMRGLWAG
jgi:CAAX protease family protein